MKNEFYLTLPSNSSLADYPNNSSNNFKVRLPTPIRLNGAEWKVALASISVPDPKNLLPAWFTEDKPLFYISWYSADSNQANKQKEGASFFVRDLDEEIDIQSLPGVDLLRYMFHYFENKRSFRFKNQPYVWKFQYK